MHLNECVAGVEVAVAGGSLPACGDGVINVAGEQCDGPDGTFFDTSCCTTECRIAPGCPLMCDIRRGIPCESPGQICAWACGWSGVCWNRADVDCETSPVCACDGVTYADRCAAFDAGVGVSHPGACVP